MLMNKKLRMRLVIWQYRDTPIHVQIYEWLHYNVSAKNPKNNNNTNALTFLKCNYKYKRRNISSESIKFFSSRKRSHTSIAASVVKRESRNSNNSPTKVIQRLLMAIIGQLMKRHMSTNMSIAVSASASASTCDVINNQVIDNIVSTRYYGGKLPLNKTQQTHTHVSKQAMRPFQPLQPLQPQKGIPKTQESNSHNRLIMHATPTNTKAVTTTQTTTTATLSSMTALNSLWQHRQQPSHDSGNNNVNGSNSNSPSSQAVLVNRHCQHRQQKQRQHQQHPQHQQRQQQHQRHQPEVLSMFMALFIALTLCARSAEAGACWQTALGNGKCREIFARNTSRADCCAIGRELFYTERELTDVEYFFASAIGEGIQCSPCMETCKNVDCGPNKKCVKRKGRAKCICAPECGAALRQRQRQQQQQQQQQQEHYQQQHRGERIYRGHQHHNEQWRNDQPALGGVTTVAAVAAEAEAGKSPRDIRSLSSEITNINLGTDGDVVALEMSQQQPPQKLQHQNQRKIIIMQSQSQSQEKPQINKKDQKPRRLLVDAHIQPEHEEKTTTRRLQIISNVRGTNRGTGHRRRLNDKTGSVNDDLNGALEIDRGTIAAASIDYRHQQRHNNNKNKNNNNDKSIIKGHSNELVHSKQRHHHRQREHQHQHQQNQRNHHKQHNRNQNSRIRGMHQSIDNDDRDSSNYDAIEVERKHEPREQQQNHRKRKHHNRSKHRKLKDPNANISNSNNNNNHDASASAFATVYNAKFPTTTIATTTLQTTAVTTTPVNSSSSADHQQHLFNHGSSNVAASSSSSSSSSWSSWSSSAVSASTNNTLNPPVAPTTSTVEGGYALNANDLTLLDGIYDKYNLHGFPLQQQNRYMFESTHHNAHPVCGTDGRTYNTECQLKKRACRTDNQSLQVAYRGHCKTSCNGVKCLNGFTCVEDHYTIPHCIACKIDCSDEDDDDDDEYAFNNDAHHRRAVADVNGDGGVGAEGIAVISRAVCGVDGKTYKSTCDINRMICKIGRSIAVAYPGPCRADRITCSDISCGPKYTCLVDLLTHEPRCVYCRYKCSRKRRPSSLRFEEGKICGVNNRTYSSWCEMRKDSCNTGFFIDVKAPGECQ